MSENTFDLENTKQQMRKGLLEYCILLAIARQEEAYTTLQCGAPEMWGILKTVRLPRHRQALPLRAYG